MASTAAPVVRTSPVSQAIVFDLFRIIAGLLFMQHGLQKLFGMFGGMGPNGGTVSCCGQFWLAGVIETFAGLLIVLGLFTGAAAFIASGEMAVAYFQAHFPRHFFPIQNGGEVVVMFCFAFLFFSAAGPGALNVDEWRAGRRLPGRQQV